nr:retrovirus-related Pol polyprotein from transposon TNT 1-94 [Tanacetum cinerariifolium]
MFKLSVSQSVSPISATKTYCDFKNVVNKTKKRHLDTFSSVRRPKHSGVVWKKKRSSNTSNVDLSSTSSAYVCNDAMNVSCNSRLCDSFDENNLFIFDDESVRISPVSKMPFRKKPRDSLHIIQICLWIIDSGCSKHMTGNRALLTNFVEKFLGTVRFGNNDFAVIASYGDVVIGSMTIKKVYYVEGLRHNLFSVGQFCDRSSNLYTISLNKVASNSSTCLLAKASSSQSWLWHQRLSHLNFATINNLVKNNLVQGLPRMKFKKDHLYSACKQGKIHRKHDKSKTAFASNTPLYLLHMDLCGPMRVESINGKRYVLVVVDDYSRYTWVFFLHSKDEASEIVQICLWIIDSGCSKHMTGNRALLTKFVEKFLGTVRFGNNDFAMIAGYGDVIIGSITTKKVYYVEGLGHNLFSVGQFCDKGLEVSFQKSTCFVRNEDGVDLLIGDRSSNLYTIALNEVASNSSTCLLAKASSSQSWLWHQRLSHLNFATINNLVKNNLVQGLPKMKFKKDHLCSTCEQGKIHRKYHKSKTAFASNKPLYLLHMDLCGPMRVQSINGKRYVLV